MKEIAGLTKHRILGYVIYPYQVCKEGRYDTVISRIVDTEKSALAALAEKFSDRRLWQLFRTRKEASPTVFMKALDEHRLTKYVIPHVNKVSKEMLLRIREMGIPIALVRKIGDHIYPDDCFSKIILNPKIVFKFDRKEEETSYRLEAKDEESQRHLKLLGQKVVVLNEEESLVLMGKEVVLFGIEYNKLKPFFLHREVRVPKRLEEHYFNTVVKRIVTLYEVEASGFTIECKQAEPQGRLEMFETVEAMYLFDLSFVYEDTSVGYSDHQTKFFVDNSEAYYHFRQTSRNRAYEQRIAEKLQAIGLQENASGRFSLPVEGDSLQKITDFFSKHSDYLSEANVEVLIRVKSKKYYTGKHQVRFHTQHNIDWFDLHIVIEFNEFEIPFTKLRRHIINGTREYKLPDGKIFLIPEEWLTRYQNIIEFGEPKGDSFQMKRHHYQLFQQYNRRKSDYHFETKPQTVSAPKGIHAELRLYQTYGYCWFYHLRKNGFGGCLADDMGLGKTLQTITFLQKIKEDSQATEVVDLVSKEGISLSHRGKGLAGRKLKQATPCSLIVVPSSLINNWEREIQKFAPDLKVSVYFGHNRADYNTFHRLVYKVDVIITTYGIVRNDIVGLEKQKFNCVILDESQFIKNHKSNTYHAVMRLNATQRLVLTGTPIENSLSDLWSQLNFVNHGLLKGHSWFQNHFINAIEKGDDAAKKRLTHLIRPFVLRRTKEEVAKDLPAISYEVVYCNMSESQEKYYEELKSSVRNDLLETIESVGYPKSSVSILNAMLRLRQAANHPQLANADFLGDSGKEEVVLERLCTIQESNSHKVLLFSSFVSNLNRYEAHLKKRGWNYCVLTGSTKTEQRQEEVNRFQNDPNIRIFLISMKAGGVGLNLTAADYVFMLDPWWNPAVEDQAISRAHRIGQEKPVFVSRFISKNSIEEKIAILQETKSQLAEAFVNTQNPFKVISEEEVMGLLD